MKFHETSFIEYLKKTVEYNIHPELEPLIDRLPKTIDDCFNIILYGESGVGKYTQALRILSRYSASSLLHEKKITLTTEKHTYGYRMSDIHYEIDMGFLGCNAKLLWNDIISQITNILITKPVKNCFILCKNYHTVHKELLDIFYSYMQVIKKSGVSIQLYFILLTEHVGFIPNYIIDRSLLISVKRPAEDILAGMADVETTCVEPTQNLKNLYYNFNTDSGSQTSLTKIVCGNIIDKITSYTFTNEFRDAVYDILIYDLDAVECFWFVFVHMSKQKTIDGSLMNKDISDSLYLYLKHHNNNYREIFHESGCFFYL
jgi:hypothetical protein